MFDELDEWSFWAKKYKCQRPMTIDNKVPVVGFLRTGQCSPGMFLHTQELPAWHCDIDPCTRPQSSRAVLVLV